MDLTPGDSWGPGFRRKWLWEDWGRRLPRPLLPGWAWEGGWGTGMHSPCRKLGGLGPSGAENPPELEEVGAEEEN